MKDDWLTRSLLSIADRVSPELMALSAVSTDDSQLVELPVASVISLNRSSHLIDRPGRIWWSRSVRGNFHG